MVHKVRLDECIEVARPLADVFAYISEFSRIDEWDPAVKRGTRETEGPVDVGTRFKIDMKAGFSIHYVVREFEQLKRLSMHACSRFFTAEEEIRFEATENGTRIRYIADFSFGALLGAFLQRRPKVMTRLGKATMRGMKRALEQDFPAPTTRRGTQLADKLLVPGLLRFSKLGYNAARSHWNPLSASLRDKRVLITGATTGIGFAAAEELARMGARLILVGRDSERTRAASQRLMRLTRNPNIDVELADMSLMADVHQLCDRLLGRREQIDVLINNAGALFNPRQITPEGLEQSFALLLLGPFILGERLHPLLRAAPEGRIVNVSSGGMYSQRLRVQDLQNEQAPYSGSKAYAHAKRGLVIVGEEWAKRWIGDGIVVNTMHPGWADTPGVQQALPEFRSITRRILRSSAEGADTIVWLAAAPEAGQSTGLFWLDREPHTTHLMNSTRESASDRQTLITILKDHMENSRQVCNNAA